MAAFIDEFPLLQVMLHKGALPVDVKHHVIELGALDWNFGCSTLKGGRLL